MFYLAVIGRFKFLNWCLGKCRKIEKLHRQSSILL